MTGGSVIVVGAGVIGTWAAWHLRRSGADVVLVDAWGAGNSRSTSGDETRILRVAYGDQPHYIDLTLRSIPQWEALSESGNAAVIRRCGVLWLFDGEDSFVTSSLPHLAARRVAIERLELSDAARRFPQLNWSDVISAFLEPAAGYVLAQRSVQLVIARLRAMGTRLRLGAAAPEISPRTGRCDGLRLTDGTLLQADAYVFACGPWLGALFPAAVGPLLRPTRQEVFYFGPPPGDAAFTADALPAWIDGARGSWYGIPGNEQRGFKISSNEVGEIVDPTTLDRTFDPARLARARAHLAHRFPRMAGAPLLESRVCQYELTPDRGLIVDRLATDPRVLLAGGGSGHAFKLAPALGELVAQLVLEGHAVEPRYALERFAGVDPRNERHWNTDIRKPGTDRGRRAEAR